jgi:hypothetical protein
MSLIRTRAGKHGETRRVGPRNVTLCGDLTGKWHRTRAAGTAPRLYPTVTMP